MCLLDGYDRSETRTEKCSKCEGTGKLTVRVKKDIRMGGKNANCDLCNGVGKIDISVKE